MFDTTTDNKLENPIVVMVPMVGGKSGNVKVPGCKS